MPNCKVNVDANANPLAHGIYQDLSKLGVSCEDMDQGYNVVNYAGIHCPDKAAKTCIKSKGDGVVEAEEVLEYALDRYETYRQVIEGRLGSPLPWVLDDLDPKTPFDAEIRGKVNAAISELKKIITSKGIKEGTPEYNGKLAAGLTWFVAAPSNGRFLQWKASNPSGYKTLKQRMEKDGLGEFLAHLEKNGGFYLKGDADTEEYTALEALQHDAGECMEYSKILFALFQMAKLAPVFIDENPLKEKSADPDVQRYFAKTLRGGKADGHVCVGLDVGGHMRLFDPLLMSSDAHYTSYTPVSPRQFLAFDYSNRGNNLAKAKAEPEKVIYAYSKTLLLDPLSRLSYKNIGTYWANRGEYDKAISVWDKALTIDPEMADVYMERGRISLIQRGEVNKGLSDFTRAIQLGLKLPQIYAYRATARIIAHDFKNAVEDLSMALHLVDRSADRVTEDIIASLDLYYTDWMKKEEKQIADLFKQDTSETITAAMVRMVMCFILWQKGDKDDAADKFGYLTTELAPTQKPASSTMAFLGKMLDAMPVDMRKDPRIQGSIKSLNKYLTTR